MKMLKNLRSRLSKNITKNQRGQGATEYILLLTVVVGLVVAFGKPIKDAFMKKVGAVESKMDEVTGE